MKLRVTAILTAVLLLTPALTMAAGLVPCGGPGEPVCQACYAVDMLNGVLDWLVGILAVVFALIVVTAGFNLVTSAGNTAAKAKAKSMITNAFIGFVIVLAAWLLIDYGMKMLVSEGAAEFGTWNTVQCVDQPVTVWRATKVETTQECYSTDDCAAKVEACQNENEEGSGTVSGAGGSMKITCSFNSRGRNPADLSAAGACDSSVVAKHFPEEVGNAQCIIRDESSCGGKMVSKTDILKSDGRAFSYGPMQINLTVHELVGCGPGGSTLDCKAAFSGRNYGANVVNEDLYQQCAAAAQNVECNLSNGKRLRDRRGNWNDWSTAAGCGLR